MTETWLRIPEFPKYEVSDMGRVRRALDAPARGAQPGKVLSPRYNRRKDGFDDGYLYVRLSNGSRQHVARCYVHHLVALVFLEDYDFYRGEGWEIHHIDSDTSHNAAVNLEWVTPSENKRYAWVTRRGGR
jgi:hypothetical protein